ncbi:hypothetical protein RND71_011832 [Anisodus tanguticus]|uniref:Uncharacterized protein n=1 Tax=Anisodus tanguticus TaxID=243964 RepID=A0AAE1SDF5_9SOLA|nr:hypothetical protein RND71_011832 [Anisodus tanguticus]
MWKRRILSCHIQMCKIEVGPTVKHKVPRTVREESCVHMDVNDMALSYHGNKGPIPYWSHVMHDSATEDYIGFTSLHFHFINGIFEKWSRIESRQRQCGAKKAAYAKLVEIKDDVEKWTNRKLYKMARKEAKLAVIAAKTAVLNACMWNWRKKGVDKKLYRLAKARGRKARDFDHVRCIKDEDGKVLVEDAHIRRRYMDFGYCENIKVEEVQGAVHGMRRGRAIGSDRSSCFALALFLLVFMLCLESRVS